VWLGLFYVKSFSGAQFFDPNFIDIEQLSLVGWIFDEIERRSESTLQTYKIRSAEVLQNGNHVTCSRQVPGTAGFTLVIDPLEPDEPAK
jgi:hypothetical protein